jgi:hypothetical protein
VRQGSTVVLHSGKAGSCRGTRFGDERRGDPRLHQRAQLDFAICATDCADWRRGARTSRPDGSDLPPTEVPALVVLELTRTLTGDPGRSWCGTRRAPGLSRIAIHRSRLDRHNVVRVLRQMQVSHVGDGEARKPPVAKPGRRRDRGRSTRPHCALRMISRRAGGRPLQSPHPGKLAIALAAICDLGRSWC